MSQEGRSSDRPDRPGLLRGARGFAFLAALALAAFGQETLDEPQSRLFRASEAAFAEGRYADAAAGYADLAAALPNTAEVHAKLGLSRFLDRKCDRSAPAFQRALELRPDLKAARVLLAICLSELGRYREALPGLEEGYADPPNYEGVRRLAGLELVRTYLGLRRHAEAAKVTAELQIAHPDDPEILFHANRTYREAAVQAAFDIARVAPDSVWGHQAMGEAYESRHFHDLAAMEYRKALEKEPDRPGLRYRLGEALLAAAADPGQATEALAQFKLELAANPSHASAALRAGQIVQARSGPEDALQFLERAARLRPAFAGARLALGKALLELGRVAEATGHLEAAAEANPADAGIRYQLAQAYREAGDREAQRRELAEYRRLQSERRELDQRILLGQPGDPAGEPLAESP